MYIYNVTIKVEKPIAEQWLEWLKNEHIPDVLSTKCFHDAKVLEILELNDEEGPTYAIQYFANTEEDYRNYISQFAEGLRQKGFHKWGNKFIAFRTLMKAVN